MRTTISKDNSYGTLPPELQRLYIWDKANFFLPGVNNDWSNPYACVYKANISLKSLENISSANQEELWNNVKGQALFHRARAFLDLVFIFSLAYDSSTFESDLGIPLRLDPDFNLVVPRSNVRQTYEQIISDFKESISLLPNKGAHKVRPSKAASYAYLARTYLAMRQYDSCLKYSALCLSIQGDLMNFNSDPEISSGTGFLIKRMNKETIFELIWSSTSTLILTTSRARISSEFYGLYNDDDLRKNVFFRANTGTNAGTYNFRGSYSNSNGFFTGVAVDEVYLMRAECNARQGNVASALDDLNTLMENRWRAGRFVRFDASTSLEVLDMILIERRKELLMRNIRWIDIKRLNKENANISLTRVVNGQTYILPPNSNRFALPIPEDVIAISGIIQNNR